MKLIAALAAGVVLLALSACNGTAPTVPQTPAQVLSTIHADVTKACSVAQDTLSSVVAMQSQLPADQQDVIGKVSKGVNDFCALHDSVTVASVQEFTKTAIPAAIKLVSTSTLNQTTKLDIQLAMIAMQAALNSALVQLAPASTTLGAGAVLIQPIPAGMSFQDMLRYLQLGMVPV